VDSAVQTPIIGLVMLAMGKRLDSEVR
jgi:hypothetical protein